MKLFDYHGKINIMGNLTEAYKQIETLEKKEKRLQQKRGRRLIAHYRKTGNVLTGWHHGLDRAIKNKKKKLKKQRERIAREAGEHDKWAEEGRREPH